MKANIDKQGQKQINSSKQTEYHQYHKQPIHLYFNNNNNNKNNNFIINSTGKISNSKYYSSQSAPLSSLLADRYKKFITKIQLLQTNLNRLNGQHYSLQHIFTQLSIYLKQCQIFNKSQQIRRRVEQNKINKFIQQKRFQARQQLAYDEFNDKFKQLQTLLFAEQGHNIYKMEKYVEMKQKQFIELKNNLSNNLMNNINNSNLDPNLSLVLKSTITNSKNLLDKIQQQLKTQYEKLYKQQVNNVIYSQYKLKQQRIKSIKSKIGQLYSILQYELYLQKQLKAKQYTNNNKNKKNKLLSKLGININNISNKDNSDNSSNKNNNITDLGLIEIKLMNDQQKLIIKQTTQRLQYQIGCVDTRIVELIKNQSSHHTQSPQKYQQQKKYFHFKKDTIDQQQQYNKIIPYNNFNESIQLKKQLFKMTNQLKGIRKYLTRSRKRIKQLYQQIIFPHEIGQIYSGSKQVYKQNQQQMEFIASLDQLEFKVETLLNNLLKLKCPNM